MRNQIPEGVDRDRKIERYQIRLPADLVDQTDFERGWNDEIKKAMINYLKSPFNSRIDRIQTKEQIIRYKNDEINKLQDQTQEIVDQIESAETKIETIDEYKQLNPSDRSKRRELLAQLAKNRNLNKKHINQILIETHDINSEQYRHEEINKIWEDHDLAYYVYDKGDNIGLEHNLDSLRKNNITKINSDIKDLHDALKVVDALLDAHETLEIPFITKYIEPQINQSVKFNKHPNIEVDGSIIRRID
jgi:chromosome segregation ATPase